MYDIDELESKWKKYRKKIFLKKVTIISVLISLILLPFLYITLYKDGYNNQKISKNKISSSKNLKEEKEPLAQEKIISPIPKSEVYVKPKSINNENSPLPQTKPKMIITFSNENTSVSHHKDSEKIEKVNKNVIRAIEKRFPLSRDYDDAMYLAKYFYRKRNYKKAEYWAMQANMIDSSQPQSWIIFGKAKAKQGHRVEALRVLQAFYDKTGNQDVKFIIDRMRKGKSY